MRRYYKNILVSAVFIFFVIGCNGQKHEKKITNETINIPDKEIDTINKISDHTNKKSKVMKKLDRIKLEKYKKHKKENQFEYTENDSVFKLEDHGNIYKEIKNKIGEKHLTTVNVYDKENLIYIGGGTYIFDFPAGIHREYNLEGNIVKEKNFDKDFPFSFQKLKQKLLSEFDIDVDNLNLDLEITRGVNPSEMKSQYAVTLYNKENRSFYKYIVVDGHTGETIEVSNGRLEE